MPQATDLVIKNGAATPVDKTFTLISPAAGDGSVAEWALKEGSISSVFPRLTASSSKNGNSSRSVAIKFRLPSSYTDTVTGLTMVNSSAEANVKVVVPNDFPESLKGDFVAFLTNSLSHALIKAVIKDASPAT